jgi:hypothetical protein
MAPEAALLYLERTRRRRSAGGAPLITKPLKERAVDD